MDLDIILLKAKFGPSDAREHFHVFASPISTSIPAASDSLRGGFMAALKKTAAVNLLTIAFRRSWRAGFICPPLMADYC